MSYTADLNPGQSIDANRAQHLAEFTAYLTTRPADALHDMATAIEGTLHVYSDAEDITTQRAKLAAVRDRLAVISHE